MMAGNDTAITNDWPLSLTEARRILEGKAGPISTKQAVETVFGEISRLNGVVNTQARCINDVRKALNK